MDFDISTLWIRYSENPQTFLKGYGVFSAVFPSIFYLKGPMRYIIQFWVRIEGLIRCTITAVKKVFYHFQLLVPPKKKTLIIRLLDMILWWNFWLWSKKMLHYWNINHSIVFSWLIQKKYIWYFIEMILKYIS